MPTIPEMVAKITELYATQLPPATPEQLERADRVFTEQFGIGLPADYRALLELCNGIAFNGVMFYATEDGRTRKGADRFGLAESNQRLLHSTHEIDSTLRFVGETGDRLYAYDTADGQWKTVDRTDWTVTGSDSVHPTFEGLFAAQYDTFVDW